MLIILFIITLIASILLTAITRIYAIKHQVLDIPNSRSSHSAPTPRGGGIGIVITTLALVALAGSTDYISPSLATALLLPCFIIAILGFADDHSPLSSRLRFIIHCASALIAILLLPQLPDLPLGSYALSLSLLWSPLLALGLVWLLNLYNFMDGIDGIASTEALCVMGGASLLTYLSGDTHWSILLLINTAPIIGFLYWNWPPAKIFMGDIGSGFLGIYIGIIALACSSETSVNLWCWMILLATFISDASWTLVTRIISGQKWHQAHRSHAYQKAAKKHGSHQLITVTITAINLIWVLPMAYLAMVSPNNAVYIAIASYLPLLYLCHAYNAGAPPQEA